MKTFKVCYKHTYGRSYTYSGKYQAESIEALKAEWKANEAKIGRKNPYKIVSIKEVK